MAMLASKDFIFAAVNSFDENVAISGKRVLNMKNSYIVIPYWFYVNHYDKKLRGSWTKDSLTSRGNISLLICFLFFT